jgi:hypothetical protein
MKMLTLLAILVYLASEELTRCANAQNTATPILVELFTSEGCAGCPLADLWLQKLDTSQPIPGGQAIVLSEHVDYFDHYGWKDPYSRSLFTDRQSIYARTLGLSSPYTPQVIVNGGSELRLNDPRQVSKVLLQAVRAPEVSVSIGAITVDGSSPAFLRAHIEADGSSEKRNAEIYAVVALDHAESQVSHGENGGRHLTHVAVAQEFIKIGKVEKGKTFSHDFQAKLKPGMDPKNLRLIVFVQEPNLGNVLGAAVQESAASSK